MSLPLDDNGFCLIKAQITRKLRRQVMMIMVNREQTFSAWLTEQLISLVNEERQQRRIDQLYDEDPRVLLANPTRPQAQQEEMQESSMAPVGA